MSETLKLNVVCGTGVHKSWTASMAELIMLNKYGNQPDYFWRLPRYNEEYIALIKLSGKLGKQFGRDKLAWYIYKEPASIFNNDVGLIIWKLKGYKFNNPEFTIEELVTVYKNKFRPKEQPKNIVDAEVEIRKDIEKPKLEDLLGDV